MAGIFIDSNLFKDSFVKHLFDNGGDVLARLIYNISDVRDASFQDMHVVHELGMNVPSHNIEWVGINGAAQYGLEHGVAMTSVTRTDYEVRNATFDEAYADYLDLNEQVVGNAVDHDHPGAKVIIDQDIYEYTGPDRLVRAIFTARIFPGELPTEITHIIEEIDDSVPAGLVKGDYELFTSKEGTVWGARTNSPETLYDPEKLFLAGTVHIPSGNPHMLLFQQGAERFVDGNSGVVDLSYGRHKG